MNLSAFYLADPQRLAPMRALPKRNIAPYELPLLSVAHLRSISEAASPRAVPSLNNNNYAPSATSTPSNSETNIPPQQSVVTMLALAAARARISATTTTATRGGSNNNSNNSKSASGCCCCQFHPTVQLQHTSMADEDQLADEFDVDPRKMRPVLQFSPPPPTTATTTTTTAATATTSSSEGQQDEKNISASLMNHWNQTLAKPFLRQTPSSVSTFVELWVTVPMDTLFKKFLRKIKKEQDQSSSPSPTQHQRLPLPSSIDQDFVDLALSSRFLTLGHKLMSMLIGDSSECVSPTAVVFQCRILPSRILPNSNSRTEDPSDIAAVPEIISASSNTTAEYVAMRKWLAGCRVELHPTVEPLWILSTASDAAKFAPQQQQQQNETLSSFLARPNSQHHINATAAPDYDTVNNNNNNNNTPTKMNRRRQRGDDSNLVNDDEATAQTFPPPPPPLLFSDDRCPACLSELIKRVTPYKHTAPWVAWGAVTALIVAGLGAGWLDRARCWFSREAVPWWWQREKTIKMTTTMRKQHTEFLPRSVMISAVTLKFLNLSLDQFQQQQQIGEHVSSAEIKTEQEVDKKEQQHPQSTEGCSCIRTDVAAKFGVLVKKNKRKMILTLHVCRERNGQWMFEFEGIDDEKNDDDIDDEGSFQKEFSVPNHHLRVNVSHTGGSSVSLFVVQKANNGEEREMECVIKDVL